jgi:predicted DsbA family dithiol-disulfide isomerase
MVPEGENVLEHVAKKYGSTPEQSAANRERIKDSAAALGFTMAGSDRSRIYNTFDAHRLLHWAGIEGRQAELKHALFEAYFTGQRNVSDRDVLVDVAARAGLDPEAARAVLDSGRYTEDVRDMERLWQQQGISGVPAIIFDDRYLVSGAQPAEAFERAIRSIAAES